MRLSHRSAQHRCWTSSSSSVCCRAVHARWCIDVRYGCKQEATSLLQEWVRDVGSKAGLTSTNTRLHSGAVGVPESRLEMEVTFPTMADWEGFLAAIPFPEHKAWTQRIQSMVVDGSPQWQVYREVPVLAANTGAAAATASIPSATTSSSSSSSRRQQLPDAASTLTITDKVPLEDVLQWEQKQKQQQDQRPGAGSTPPAAPLSDSDVEEVVLDWKGEPMKISPGDKLPFKFL